jgi:26S proteasome regulatory subunit N5
MTKGEQYQPLRKEAIENCITFLLMSKYDNHSNDMMFRIKTLLTTNEWKELGINSMHVSALNLFTTEEVIITPFSQQDLFENQESLSKFDYFVNADNESLSSTKYFRKLLNTRIVEHNLRIIAKYYQRIRFNRLEQLLNLSQETLEYHLSDLSFNGDIHLKIDRPNEIISFEKKRSNEEILSEWSSDINKMMHLMETTCHLINRENMVHKVTN